MFDPTTAIRRFRLRRGLSLRELARVVGVTHGRISQQERRKEVVSGKDAERYSRYFGGSPKDYRDPESGFAALVHEAILFIDSCVKQEEGGTA